VNDDNVAAKFEVLPIGEVGELAVGGFQLATGYLNKPQQTAASFINTQWGRVYRTGDKARFGPDGTIECLGRIDDSQVKLNGQRLELGEIENALLRTPGCHSAFVTIISNMLVAFAAVEHVSESVSGLLDQCRSWLPVFMVPTDIVTMSKLPQLPSGKVDRKRLIQDYMARTTSATSDSEEALDDQEHLLCEVATTILGYKINPSTEFSPARLDSLAAIVYASALREEGTDVSVIDILSTKTPRELRKRIKPGGKSSTNLEFHQEFISCVPSNNSGLDMSKLKAILGENVQQVERVELSTPLQQSMVAETLKDADSYINRIGLELPSNAPLDLLHSSLRALAESNEILRTGFVFIGNQLCQVIWKQLDDLQIRGHSDTDDHVDSIENIERFLLRPLRMEIRHSASNKAACTLALTLHHGIYDGWTIDLMIEDLSLLLDGKLPTKRPQFSQISTYLHKVPEAMDLDSMEFWTDHLHGVGAASLPNLSTVVASEERRCVKLAKIPLMPEILADFTLQASVGPQVLFQSCLAWLWAAVHGSDDIVIGSVSSGRSLPLAGIDKIMGPCMTTLPLRVNVSRHRTILDLLRSIHSTNRQILRHGRLSLSQINKAAGLSHNSKLFDIIFAYQESPASRKQGHDAVRELWHQDATEAKLVVEIQPCENHFVCQTTFRTGFLSEALVEIFTSHLSNLIGHFTNDIHARIANIPHFFSSKSLSCHNHRPTSVETARSLSEMVENSASRYSSEAAISFAMSINSKGMTLETLTYGELNSKANRIARRIQKRGIISGEVIAIIMEKSPLLYCSILAILKAGCAYLPILPNTPDERVKVILEQAEPCLCLVDSTPSLLKLRELSMEAIDLGEDDLSFYSDTNLGMYGEPTDLAYVIYTRCGPACSSILVPISVLTANVS
jgi:ferricrocin synthase